MYEPFLRTKGFPRDFLGIVVKTIGFSGKVYEIFREWFPLYVLCFFRNTSNVIFFQRDRLDIQYLSRGRGFESYSLILIHANYLDINSLYQRTYFGASTPSSFQEIWQLGIFWIYYTLIFGLLPSLCRDRWHTRWWCRRVFWWWLRGLWGRGVSLVDWGQSKPFYIASTAWPYAAGGKEGQLPLRNSQKYILSYKRSHQKVLQKGFAPPKIILALHYTAESR